MAQALQCPDCGHREPLVNVAENEQFRCHGCGRALKVPPELRAGSDPPAAAPDPAPAPDPDPVPEPAMSAPQVAAPDLEPQATRVLARATSDDPPVAPAAPAPPAGAGLTRIEREALAAEVLARPLPLVARLAVWALWLPVGVGITFWFAIKVEWLNRDHIVNTVGAVTWDRFVPIARLLPLAALVVAVLVHVTILMLEQWSGRRRLRAERMRAASR